MFPTRPDADCAASEKKVFSAFAERLPKNWHVFHARRVVVPESEGHPLHECEIDFIVVDPARGVLVLETKGGEIRREEFGWTSTDRRGEAHEIRDPGVQAQSGARNLSRLIRQNGAFAQTYVRCGWGVIFPDVTVRTSLGADLPRALVVDEHDLHDPAPALDRLFEQNAASAMQLGSALMNALVELLAPSLRLVPLLSSQMDEANREFARMTDEQMDVLDTNGEMPRLAVKGCAGSGKTLIAIERARRRALAGDRVLFLCYNTLLAQFLSLRVPEKTEASGGSGVKAFEVMTFHHFAKLAAKSAGLRFEGSSQEFWDTEAPDILLQSIEKLPDVRYDCVVVDEAQDFKEYWWLPIERLLVGEGSSLWAFYDPNQNLFDGSIAASLKLQPAVLKHNCRNSARIGQHAFAYVGDTPNFRGDTPEGAPVEVIKCSDERAMLDAVRRELHHLVVELKIPSDRILVLTPHRSDNSAVRAAGKLGNFTFVDYPAVAQANEVPFSTLQRYKGLEADAIILCEVDRASHACTDRHLYVAASRARHLLFIAEYGSAG